MNEINEDSAFCRVRRKKKNRKKKEKEVNMMMEKDEDEFSMEKVQTAPCNMELFFLFHLKEVK